MKTCIVVPHYDHLDQFRRFLPKLVALELPLLVVDDASPPETVDALQELLATVAKDATLVSTDHNRGKGGAVKTGLRTAQKLGFSHALQIDADGQHSSTDVEAFLSASRERQSSVICGKPVFDTSISALRYYGRHLTWSLGCIETLGRDIRDAMCGFRLYPLATIISVIDSAKLGERMAFDPELLVRAVWAGIPLHYIPVHVAYPEDGKSHFNYCRDNIEISWMHMRLLFGMLARSPMLIARKFESRSGVTRT